MSLRLSIITTRTGDDGSTGLGDGSRLPKDAPRVHAIGEVDELNSMIGLWRTESLPQDIDTLLNQIQNDLFDLGGELCIPGDYVAVTEAHILRLDEAIKHYNTNLSRLQEFILPGGSRAAALSHVTRTLARRAERSVIALERDETVHAPVRQYLNRLSDLFFVLARALNQSADMPDVLWTGPVKPTPQTA